MNYYIAVTGLFIFLGVYLFVLARLWYRHLTRLAARYDVPGRRKRAANQYFIFVALIGAPMLVVLHESILLGQKNMLFVGIALIVSIAPAVIWWFRNTSSLCELGYGRRPCD